MSKVVIIKQKMQQKSGAKSTSGGVKSLDDSVTKKQVQTLDFTNKNLVQVQTNQNQKQMTQEQKYELRKQFVQSQGVYLKHLITICDNFSTGLGWAFEDTSYEEEQKRMVLLRLLIKLQGKEQQNINVALMDTADRMQNNESSIRQLP
ncbi:unnamed protein product (macronuclear) [Paramecium tetraurelia]|uniref:ENT domain-containing protein n=1 Tax=Paramecium tetraurelia TaxID=5888 RepID=A0EG59_PARTE|nr:uncharacterized protein GSPATT00026624001 [Paramecium tetraurelia]CAK94300.1 unnamed protein product [Paramecium tetraurelia]|eukprot:XP_001461673.1 hypothetical protein (macronuclear) [Paramecium tetraurelia strain d4-2]